MKSILTLLVVALLFSCGNGEDKINEHKTPRQTKDPLSQEKEGVSTIPKKTDSEEIYDTIRAKNSGVIDWISKRKVKKGQTLYGYNNSEAFNTLDTKKKKFRLAMDSLVKTANGDLNYVKEKWQKFSSSLKSDTLLPNFPKIEYKEEGMHFGSEHITQSYNEIALLESKMKANFVTSKASYSNIIWKISVGTQVKKGKIIAIGKRA